MDQNLSSIADRPKSFAASQPRPGAAWWAIVVLAALYSINNVDRRLIFIMVPSIEHDLHLSDVQMSLLLGPAFGLIYLVSGIPWGWLADRFPRKFIIFTGTALWGLSTAVCGMAGGYTELLFARMALGVSEGALGPAAQSIIANLFPRSQLSFPMSVYSLGVPIGSGISLLFGGLMLDFLAHRPTMSIPLLGDRYGWQFIFVVAGLATVFFGLLAFFLPEPNRASREAVSMPDYTWGKFLREKRSILLSIAIGFGAMIMLTTSISTWGPTFMVRAYNWSPGHVGVILGAVECVSGILGYLFAGRFVDRMIHRGIQDAHLRYPIWTLFFALPLGLIAFTSPNPWIFSACIFGFIFLIFPCLGYGAAVVQIVSPPHLRSRMAGLFLLSITIFAITLGPTIVASVTQYLFHDRKAIGWSLAIVIAIFSPVSIFAFWRGLAPLRAHVEAS